MLSRKLKDGLIKIVKNDKLPLSQRVDATFYLQADWVFENNKRIMKEEAQQRKEHLYYLKHNSKKLKSLKDLK